MKAPEARAGSSSDSNNREYCHLVGSATDSGPGHAADRATRPGLAHDNRAGCLLDTGGDSRCSSDDDRALASALSGESDHSSLVHEDNFSSVYQQGEKVSMFVTNVDKECLVGGDFQGPVRRRRFEVLFHPDREHIAAQLKVAHERDPAGDLTSPCLMYGHKLGV